MKATSSPRGAQPFQRRLCWPRSKHVAATALALLLLTPAAQAAPAAGHSDDLLSHPLALVVVLALLGLLPFAFMAITAFVKISTVLSIAKSAIGAQGIPSNTVVVALGAALTLVAMAPVGTKIGERIEPVLASNTSWSAEKVRSAVTAIREPLRDFLLQNAAEKEIQRFFDLSRQVRLEADRAQVQRSDFTVIVPAFLISELGEAFALGFAIFLPFLILDLVVGNVLLALGMQTLSVSQVSLPFKLLLFVAADGWGLLAQTLISGYRMG